jgi:molybdate-binding protein
LKRTFEEELTEEIFSKATEVNRRRGSGTREKVSSRRINLECNTFVHGNNAKNLPV